MLVEDDRVDQMAFNRSVKENGSPHDYTVASFVAEARVIRSIEDFWLTIVKLPRGEYYGR